MRLIGTREEISRIICAMYKDYDQEVCDGYVVDMGCRGSIDVDDINELVFPDGFTMQFKFIEYNHPIKFIEHDPIETIIPCDASVGTKQATHELDANSLL